MRTTNEDHMIYCSWNMTCNRQKFLPYWIIFYPFSPLTTQKIKILYSNWKNACRYYHFTHFNHKWQSYDVRFLRCGAQQTEFFVILDLFLLFYPPAPPPMDPKNQNFEKMTKNPEDIFILQMCTRNNSHMMYGSWDMKCNKHI